MAELQFNPIQFPWSDFLVAAQMRNQNQQQMFKDIAGIGQGLGNIGLEAEKRKNQDILSKALAYLRNPTQPMDMAFTQPDATGGIAAGPNQNYTPAFEIPQAPPPVSQDDMFKALMTLNPKDSTEQVSKALFGTGGNDDLMYTPEQAEAAVSGDIKKFNLLNKGRPVSHKTASLIGTGQYRQDINNRFGQNMDWRQSVEWQNVAESFNKDPGFNKARESLAGADKVLRLANMQSALGDEALGFLVPRALEEVGNLAQAERTAVRISPNVVNRAQSLLQRNIGPGTTLTLRDRADLKDVMTAFRKVQEYKIEQIQDYYAGQAAENYQIPYTLAKKRLGDLSKITTNYIPPPDFGKGQGQETPEARKARLLAEASQ